MAERSRLFKEMQVTSALNEKKYDNDLNNKHEH